MTGVIDACKGLEMAKGDCNNMQCYAGPLCFYFCACLHATATYTSRHVIDRQIITGFYAKPARHTSIGVSASWGTKVLLMATSDRLPFSHDMSLVSTFLSKHMQLLINSLAGRFDPKVFVNCFRSSCKH